MNGGTKRNCTEREGVANLGFDIVSSDHLVTNTESCGSEDICFFPVSVLQESNPAGAIRIVFDRSYFGFDATLPGATLDAAVTRLRQAAPATPIVLHAWHRDASVITDAALAQAEGVAWKSDAEGLIRLVGGVIVRRTE